MRRFLPWILLVVVITAAAGVIWYLRGQVRSESLARENAEAQGELQRTVLGSQAKRMQQLELERDSVDRVLKTKPKVEIRTVTVVKEVKTSGTAVVTADPGDSVRRATFISDSSWHPYHGEISVALPRPDMLLAGPDSAPPAPPTRATLDLRLGIAPIPATIRIRCSTDADAGGVRRAYTTAQDLPSWASIDLGQPIADPEVCSPAPRALQFRLNAPTVAVMGGAALLGLLAAVLVF